jgi:putative FmdB family regulatory protein
MPIYSYKCEKCGRVFDKFVKYNNGNGENNTTKCIYCNSNAKRLFLPAGIIFKGSGFYKTDYRSVSAKSSFNVPESKGVRSTASNPKKSDEKALDNKKVNDSKTVKESSAILNKDH